jgi:hypothetical protein
VSALYSQVTCTTKYLPLHTTSEIQEFNTSTAPRWLSILALAQGPAFAAAAKASLVEACLNLPFPEGPDVMNRGYIMGAIPISASTPDFADLVQGNTEMSASSLCVAVRSCDDEYLLGADGAS